MTDAELIAKIKAEIERRITDNTFGAKLELIDILAWLDTLESEKPMNQADAMKELDEKIALVKQRGTWDGVDVDKYMDEVRGREPEKPMGQGGLDEEIERYLHSLGVGYGGWVDGMVDDDLRGIARHFAEWQKEAREHISARIATTSSTSMMLSLNRYGTNFPQSFREDTRPKKTRCPATLPLENGTRRD